MQTRQVVHADRKDAYKIRLVKDCLRICMHTISQVCLLNLMLAYFSLCMLTFFGLIIFSLVCLPISFHVITYFYTGLQFAGACIHFIIPHVLCSDNQNYFKVNFKV